MHLQNKPLGGCGVCIQVQCNLALDPVSAGHCTQAHL